MFKIQVRATNKHGHLPVAPTTLQQWQDTERMPDFETWEAAEEWLTANKARQLEQFGLEFQIIKIESPTPADS